LHIAMGSSALLTNHITGKSTLHYADFTVLPQLATESIAFAVKADSDISDGKAFLERLRKDPSSVRIGLPSIASSNHIAASLLVKSVNADPKQLRAVVFNSSAQGITALLGGHIDVVAAPALNTIPHMNRGALRVVLVTAPKRLAGDLSGVPTARELGADVVIGAYRSVLGPKGMAADKVAYWDDAFKRMVATAEWKEFMRKNAWEDNFLPSRESADFVKGRYEAFRGVLTDLGLAKSPQ
jgi:putative tricarboxylic transport membrane protein